MKPWILPSALSLSLCAVAWPKDAERYPLREIDRPLILPKKMWQEVLVQNSYIRVERESTYVDQDVVTGFFPLVPSWSITDNLEWNFVPLPLFKYLLTHNNINAENGPVVRDLSVTLEGGLSGFAVTDRGSDSYANLGFSAKRPLGSWVWWEGTVQTYYHDLDFSSIGASAGIGLQLSNRMYAKASYDFSNLYEGGSRVYQGGTVVFGTNFTANLSLQLKTSLLVGTQLTTINPGASLAFQW